MKLGSTKVSVNNHGVGGVWNKKCAP